MGLFDERPASMKRLYKSMQRQSVGLDGRAAGVYMDAMHHAVLMQFLSGGDYLKGGAALQLSYPLNEGRSTRDVDTVFADSKERFEQRMRRALEEGWEGFTGDITPLPHAEGTLMPEGSQMSRYRIRLRYRGQDFSTFAIEAVPDLNGCASQSGEARGEALDLLERLGFHVRHGAVMDKTFQLAEKLHALSRPGKYRGRDLADIMLIYSHEDISIDRLREVSRKVVETQRQHPMRMLDENEKELYKTGFKEASTPFPFDDAWQVTQDLLRQVDETHRNEWQTDMERRIEEDMQRLDSEPVRHGPQMRDSRGRFSHNAW